MSKNDESNLGGNVRMVGEAGLIAAPAPIILSMQIRQHWRVECRRANGSLKWVEEFSNLVVNVGLNEYLQRIFKSSGFTAADYIGLKGTGSVAAGDTMGSHSGWSELTPYSDGTRPSYTPGSVASQSVNNSASKAVFNINGTSTIYGMFAADNNTKGGSSGILLGADDFAASRGVGNGDTLNVTMTASLTSS